MSWVEVKRALNSSLGTSTFLPLDKQIQEAILPAGFGSFDRTLFERSNVDYSITNKNYTYFVLGKFIIPQDGLYKISFDYKLHYQSSATGLLNAIFQLNNQSDVNGTFRNYASWYFNTSIGDGINIGATEAYRFFSFDTTSVNITEWKSVTEYFHLKKGTTAALSGARFNRITNDKLIFMFRNVKVSY